MKNKVSTNDLDVRVVRPSDIRAELNYAFNRKRPVFIWGPPGVGKWGKPKVTIAGPVKHIKKADDNIVLL